jgi:tetrahydromethanopterin S-methyltransferase subunit H
LSKHSRLRCLSAKEKAEAEQITEVVEEAKTEADIILQAQAEGAAIRTKMKVQANSKLMDKGMTNPKSNVIIVRNMGTMPMNVGENKMT